MSDPLAIVTGGRQLVGKKPVFTAHNKICVLLAELKCLLALNNIIELDLRARRNNNAQASIERFAVTLALTSADADSSSA
jgi:hypothetical protein